MDESPKKVNAFESAFEAWLNKAGPQLEVADDVETESICSQMDKNNNTDSDVDVDLPAYQLDRESPSLISSQHRDIQNDNKTIRLVTKRQTKLKPPSMIVCQAIKRKYFSHAHRPALLQQDASNKMRSYNSLSRNRGTRNILRSERYRKLTDIKESSPLIENYIGAKCPTSSQGYTAPTHGSDCLVKYEVRTDDDKTQFKSSVGKFTDNHGLSGHHSTEVSPVSDAGYGEDVAVDSEHDDISRRSNGYHSMEEFQLTSVSPPSQSESPLSSAGEGSHLPFLCSKTSGVGFSLQSMYIDRRVKSARKNHSPNSYDADSDFVESPHSCHLPTSKSPSHTVSQCTIHKSPDHMAVPSVAKYYKLDCQRDSERPLILKIKCDRSPLHKKSPIYFCENVTPTDSPTKLKLIDSGKTDHAFANENISCKRRTSNCAAEISDLNPKVEQTEAYKPDSVERSESVTDRLCECDSANTESAISPDHSCDDAVLEEAAKTPQQNRQKLRRNSSRVCACCMSSPKKHKFKGEKRKRSLSSSNTTGSIVFSSGSTVHLKCDVTQMTPKQKKFVKSALNLSSLQQKLHTLFIHLFPRLEPALLQMPPESLRFAEMLNEVIKTLEGSTEEEEQIDSEELSKQLLGVSLKANDSVVTVFEPHVDLCNTPKNCLEEYQERIYTLLKLLLPDLTMKYDYVLRFPKDLEKFLDNLLFWNYRPL